MQSVMIVTLPNVRAPSRARTREGEASVVGEKFVLERKKPQVCVHLPAVKDHSLLAFMLDHVQRHDTNRIFAFD